MKPSSHQRKVLATLLALETEHAWQWWPRCAIGHVIDAGGYHGTIQLKTMSILKDAGLVMTERTSWDVETRATVRCNCACWAWGLTAAGREMARSMKVGWPADSIVRMREAKYHANIISSLRDEDEPPPGRDQDDGDDDDGPGDEPKPVAPRGDLCHT